jgi:hypothetical protein
MISTYISYYEHVNLANDRAILVIWMVYNL